MSKILKTTLNLPDRIQAICWIQFWAWIGWFPFLFYSTTWVGEVYFRYHPESRASKDTLGDVGRVGSLSLVVFSIVTFIGSIGLPWVIDSPEESQVAPSFTPRPPEILRPLVTVLQKCRPSLLTAWQASHLLFAGAMCMAPFVRSFYMATLIVSLCGIPWALACWAPFAFMGIEINRLTQSTVPPPVRRTPSGKITPQQMEEEASSNRSTGETAGIYLGILNLFTTLPQFVGTFISMIVFYILEPGKSPELHQNGTEEDIKAAADKPNAIAVCLFIGALSAVGAAYATGRMKRSEG